MKKKLWEGNRRGKLHILATTKMGCLKILHSEQKSALSKNWKIFVGGVEKISSSEKNRINYYPGGMLQPGRSFNANSYRYGGAGGQEKDDEIAGSGNSYTAKYWQYDSRLLRRWNRDPITYPWHSSYAVNNNNPIIYIDPLGLYGTKGKAERKRKRAVRRYGEERVGPITDIGSGNVSGDSNEDANWGFGVTNDPNRSASDRFSTGDVAGVGAYKRTHISDNKGFRVFDKSQPGLGVRSPLTFNDNHSNTDGLFTGIGGAEHTLSTLSTAYGVSATQVFSYADEGLSAVQLTSKYSKSFMATSKVLGKANIVTGVLTTGYSYYKVGDALLDPTRQVDNWDVADAAVGTTTTVVGVLVLVGTISNPIGWAVAAGGAIYYIYRAYDD